MPLTVKKRGAVYHARGTVAGQRVYLSTGCRRRADADAWARRYEAELIARHAHGVDATYTLAEAALDYMHAGGERRFLGPILDYFGPDYLLRDLDNAAVNAAALTLFPEAAPATVNRCLITPLRAITTQAAEDGRTHWRKFRTRRGDRARTRWLRPAELDALLYHAGPALRPVIAGLVGSGARVSELLGADAAHFYARSGEIWLDETKNDFPRMLRLPGRARDAILAAEVPAAGALFRRPGRARAPYVLGAGRTPIKTAFHRARAAAGLGPDVTPHTLRHTWATWYYAATRDFGGLLDLGGWRVSDMAQRYRKIAPEGLADDLAAHGWDFRRLGRDLPAPGTAGVILDRSDGGFACRWPRPDQAPPAARVRLLSA